MIWIAKRINTTVEWVGWSQEFRDLICSRGVGREEQKWPLCDAKSETLRYNLWFQYLRQIRVLQMGRHFTGAAPRLSLKLKLCMNSTQKLSFEKT